MSNETPQEKFNRYKDLAKSLLRNTPDINSSADMAVVLARQNTLPIVEGVGDPLRDALKEVMEEAAASFYFQLSQSED